jgi:ketosteroid isomerase-like protein
MTEEEREIMTRHAAYWQPLIDSRADGDLRHRPITLTTRRRESMIPAGDFDQAIEASHRALDEIARGNPGAFFELYSRHDDATLANPYGPPARGWNQIQEAGRRAASNYRDGKALGFENFAKCGTEELGYILEIERFEAKVAGRDEVSPVALRVTSIFHREEGAWRLLHRHADPITTLRPGDSVIQTS